MGYHLKFTNEEIYVIMSSDFQILELIHCRQYEQWTKSLKHSVGVFSILIFYTKHSIRYVCVLLNNSVTINIQYFYKKIICTHFLMLSSLIFCKIRSAFTKLYSL
jgi:hypothetical protein